MLATSPFGASSNISPPKGIGAIVVTAGVIGLVKIMADTTNKKKMLKIKVYLI